MTFYNKTDDSKYNCRDTAIGRHRRYERNQKLGEITVDKKRTHYFHLARVTLVKFHLAGFQLES